MSKLSQALGKGQWLYSNTVQLRKLINIAIEQTDFSGGGLGENPPILGFPTK
ncbi:MAG: hypothetical protein VKN72_18645 [Nostocales cyanobacterium 94392]|nr:hypothetical protein [Nostocales cyanobacterium 94392]